MQYYAHSLDSRPDNEWQSLTAHLKGTAELAGAFADDFGAGILARAAALLHDYGKATKSFQARLRGTFAKVDHSTAGGQEAVRRYGKCFGHFLSYAILGHHAGLPDAGSDQSLDGTLIRRLSQRLKETPDPDVLASLPETLQLPFKDLAHVDPFSIAFLIRMIYSTLVDADSLDTERFCDRGKFALRSPGASMKELSVRLARYLSGRFPQLPAGDPSQGSHISRLRSQILAQSAACGTLPQGVYTLTVPTGGGKTFSSLSFALNHADAHGLSRVIYAIPFTSIIEQNAAEFIAALGDENVLEHHSSVSFGDGEDDDDQSLRLRLTAENWDAPLIITTNVQFFESLFSSRRSKCRKLHNIAGSVIVLDEAQMLPSDFLRPCLAALAELVRHYRCTVVLCTGTQPALSDYFPADLRPREIMEAPLALYEAFRKVRIEREGTLSLSELAERIVGERQALAILNTRGAAAEAYALIAGEPGAFHLSARMTAVHRSRKIHEIKDCLKDGAPCRVVSTQLVEAGVNLDFPVVYRAQAGLDSIVQAAGRCNREGKLREGGQVRVFALEGQTLRGWFSRTAQYGREAMDAFPEDPLSPDAIARYFSMLYNMHPQGLDAKGILAALGSGSGPKNLRFPFKSVDRDFQLIEDNTHTILIPHDDESLVLAGRIRAGFASRADLRRLGRYGVQVYDGELKELLKTHSVEPVGGAYLLIDLSLYDAKERGLLHIDEGGYRNDFLYN